MVMDIARDEVHLWWQDFDADPSADDEVLLTPGELQRAARYVQPQHGRHFITHRAWLRRLLALYLDCAPHALDFTCGAHGKPALTAASGQQQLHFNLSHGGGRALCAIARDSPLGVDIEACRPRADHLRLAERYFAPRELAWLRAADAAHSLQRFYTVWTRKEAFIKATGQGLSRGLASFDVRAGENGPVAVSEQRSDGAPWFVQSIEREAGYAMALCSRLAQPRLCWPAPPADRERALRPRGPQRRGAGP